jgi:hypothetical protein
VNENGMDATTTAHAETAAAVGDQTVAGDLGIVPEHLRRALEDVPSVGWSERLLRAASVLVLGVLLAAGAAWSAGVIPSPLSLLP